MGGSTEKNHVDISQDNTSVDRKPSTKKGVPIDGVSPAKDLELNTVIIENDQPIQTIDLFKDSEKVTSDDAKSCNLSMRKSKQGNEKGKPENQKRKQRITGVQHFKTLGKNKKIIK